MRMVLLGITGLTLLCNVALGFNNRGHMLVAQLAWLELDAPARTAVVEILKKHPHYEEFLIEDKPDNIGEDEWAFMRAATWSDWVKSHHSSEFDHRDWHYINIPFVVDGSEVTPPDNMPAPVHIVRQISWCSNEVLNGTGPGAEQAKAVNLCWIFHLMGDIHQPLHCTAMFSDQFPEGDQGGNRAIVKIGHGRKKLHAFWDGLFGNSTSVNSIRSNAAEIQAMEAQQPELTASDLANHTTPISWAEEGFALAVEHAYRNGALEVANSQDNPTSNEIPVAPADYAPNAGKVIRVSVAKAGHRLAKQLKQLVQ